MGSQMGVFCSHLLTVIYFHLLNNLHLSYIIYFYPMKKKLQISFICVPWLLFVKPFILRHLANQSHKHEGKYIKKKEKNWEKQINKMMLKFSNFNSRKKFINSKKHLTDYK